MPGSRAGRLGASKKTLWVPRIMHGRAGEVWREFEATRFQVLVVLMREPKQSISWFSLFSVTVRNSAPPKALTGGVGAPTSSLGGSSW